MLKNTQQNYGAVTKLLHWVTALLIIGLLAVGLYMDSMPASLEKLKLYNLHKSFGITVLMLFFVRLGWRIYTPAPDTLPSVKKHEARLAHTIHYFLYFAMLAMPFSGWLMSSAAGRVVEPFGLFALPHLTGESEALVKATKTFHFYFAWMIITAVSLHVLGAMKHFVIDKDKTLQRMLPFGKVNE